MDDGGYGFTDVIEWIDTHMDEPGINTADEYLCNTYQNLNTSQWLTNRHKGNNNHEERSCNAFCSAFST